MPDALWCTVRTNASDSTLTLSAVTPTTGIDSITREV
jgi:hypothetical protein